ncbi:MAG: hypothetical protein KKA07_11270 [Bacteroidetes bacterium]|nr:hypothetical protein [Bacteroidota bacterium]MBU1719639.1 hypothetical protein [Bacteroidota bacterium]
MLDQFKNWLWNQQYKRNLAGLHRDRATVNLVEAKTVVVLFEVISEDEYYRVNSFVKTLQRNQKIVNALGFVHGKLIPSYCSRRLSYDFITEKDLNWYGKPARQFFNDFVKKECDLLVDLSMKENKTLQYIAGLSRARMKVGRLDTNTQQYYDMMFITDKMSGTEEFVQTIIQYLSGLNRNKQETLLQPML